MRIYRTDDGKLVLEGDVRAAYLVYGEADEIENRDKAEVRALLAEDEPAEDDETPKAVRAPRNKAVKPEGDK